MKWPYSEPSAPERLPGQVLTEIEAYSIDLLKAGTRHKRKLHLRIGNHLRSGFVRTVTVPVVASAGAVRQTVKMPAMEEVCPLWAF